MDLILGFHAMKIAPADRKKTACSVPVEGIGHVEFNTLLFGAAGGPARFQSLLEKVLAPIPLTPMMDDVIYAGKDFKQTLEVMKKVFMRFRQANLKAKPQKCHLVTQRLHVLGHVWTPEGIHTDQGKIKLVSDWPVPHTVTEMKSFLGLCQYYAQFVEGFADIAVPLHRLTVKASRFHWTRDTQAAFESLKQALVSAPILSLFDQDGGPLIISTDASNWAVGMCLSQIQGGVQHTLAFHSRMLNKAERQYCVTQRELLAIVVAIREWHHYVAGAHFKVLTDHRPLVWLRNLKAPQGRLARWIETLEAYDFEIVYTRPTQIPHVDALSRYPVRPCSPTCPKCTAGEKRDESTQDADARAVAAVPCSDFKPHAWLASQNADRDISPILVAVQAGQKPSLEEAVMMSDVTHALFLQFNSLELLDGLLYRRYESNDGKPEKAAYQLVVPREKVQDVLRLYHDAPGSGSGKYLLYGLRRSGAPKVDLQMQKMTQNTNMITVFGALERFGLILIKMTLTITPNDILQHR